MKGLRVAGVKTIEQANQYLEETYLVWWERELTVEAAHSDDAHRPLDKSHRLEASLSHVETRQVRNDYTIPLDAELYQNPAPGGRERIAQSQCTGGEKARRFHRRPVR